ncbi:formyltransferase family protein [Shewanella sp.]|uniref:formyltransferase family protein n=1 Tax=Shewanella sp. TaxID=50422 RepID=UPI003A9842E6
MSIVFVCGNHPRHAYIARCLATTGKLAYVIVEEREKFLPTAPASLDVSLRTLFEHHFHERERIEALFFGETDWPDVPKLSISIKDLNSKAVIDTIKQYATDLLISYGCHKLNQELLDSAPKHKWNCHGGLSPWYKGAITHFWPSYMLEPQMTGMTVHQLSNQLDAGAIIHQCAAPLVRGDTLHMLAARAVTALGEDLPRLAELACSSDAIASQPQTSSGMLWRSSQWQPQHLPFIYEYHHDAIVDAYLDGKLPQKVPQLFRQF